MKKMLPRPLASQEPPRPTRDRLRRGGLALVLLLPGITACKSAQQTPSGPPAVNSPTDYTDWEILERSGREPSWKDNEETGYFWGEGSGRSEAEAFVAAEQEMRAKAARFLKTDVKEVMVIERRQIDDDTREQIGQLLKVGTDAAVHGMAVEESYRELRQRTESQFGVTHKRKQWRVVVRGRLRS